jgi:hypothetical protein
VFPWAAPFCRLVVVVVSFGAFIMLTRNRRRSLKASSPDGRAIGMNGTIDDTLWKFHCRIRSTSEYGIDQYAVNTGYVKCRRKLFVKFVLWAILCGTPTLGFSLEPLCRNVPFTTQCKFTQSRAYCTKLQWWYSRPLHREGVIVLELWKDENPLCAQNVNWLLLAVPRLVHSTLQCT